MYVDDVIAPTSSPAQAGAVFKQFECFTQAFDSTFNVGPSKSAIMGPVGADRSDLQGATVTYFDTEVPCVDSYPYLGVLLDIALSFENHFKMMIARGWSTLNTFLGAACMYQLPLPLQANEIPSRIETACLHGIEMCVLTRQAESRLNRMQAGWARVLLGIGQCNEGTWMQLVAECGWRVRLGTRMWERAIMLKARLSLLPQSNPIHQIFNTATASTTTTWVSVVRDWQMHPGLPSAIPELLETCSHDDAELARGCKINRKRLVDRYKSRHVRPVLQQYDDNAFLTSTRKSHWPYGSFQQSLDSFPAALITADWDANTWRLYRAWAVVRATGRIPLQVFNAGDLPTYMDTCPLCQQPVADIQHFLAVCTGTRDLYSQWVANSNWHHRPSNWTDLGARLFTGRLAPDTDDGDCARNRINFVGRVCRRVASTVVQNTTLETAVDAFISAAWKPSEG